MKKIWMTTSFIGYHKWDDAPDEVAFLRASHRHVFHVKLTLDVKHEDRELEFFMVKRKLDKFISVHLHEQEDIGSCEMIASKILRWAQQEYFPRQLIEVEVSEDKENGAVVSFHG